MNKSNLVIEVEQEESENPIKFEQTNFDLNESQLSKENLSAIHESDSSSIVQKKNKQFLQRDRRRKTIWVQNVTKPQSNPDQALFATAHKALRKKVKVKAKPKGPLDTSKSLRFQDISELDNSTNLQLMTPATTANYQTLAGFQQSPINKIERGDSPFMTVFQRGETFNQENQGGSENLIKMNSTIDDEKVLREIVEEENEMGVDDKDQHQNFLNQSIHPPDTFSALKEEVQKKYTNKIQSTENKEFNNINQQIEESKIFEGEISSILIDKDNNQVFSRNKNDKDKQDTTKSKRDNFKKLKDQQQIQTAYFENEDLFKKLEEQNTRNRGRNQNNELKTLSNVQNQFQMSNREGLLDKSYRSNSGDNQEESTPQIVTLTTFPDNKSRGSTLYQSVHKKSNEFNLTDMVENHQLSKVESSGGISFKANSHQMQVMRNNHQNNNKANNSQQNYIDKMKGHQLQLANKNSIMTINDISPSGNNRKFIDKKSSSSNVLLESENSQSPKTFANKKGSNKNFEFKLNNSELRGSIVQTSPQSNQISRASFTDKKIDGLPIAPSNRRTTVGPNNSGISNIITINTNNNNQLSVDSKQNRVRMITIDEDIEQRCSDLNKSKDSMRERIECSMYEIENDKQKLNYSIQSKPSLIETPEFKMIGSALEGAPKDKGPVTKQIKSNLKQSQIFFNGKDGEIAVTSRTPEPSHPVHQKKSSVSIKEEDEIIPPSPITATLYNKTKKNVLLKDDVEEFPKFERTTASIISQQQDYNGSANENSSAKHQLKKYLKNENSHQFLNMQQKRKSLNSDLEALNQLNSSIEMRKANQQFNQKLPQLKQTNSSKNKTISKTSLGMNSKQTINDAKRSSSKKSSYSKSKDKKDQNDIDQNKHSLNQSKKKEKVTVKVILDSDSDFENSREIHNIDELNKTYSKVIIAKATRLTKNPTQSNLQTVKKVGANIHSGGISTRNMDRMQFGGTMSSNMKNQQFKSQFRISDMGVAQEVAGEDKSRSCKKRQQPITMKVNKIEGSLVVEHGRTIQEGYIPLSKNEPYQQKKSQPIIIKDKFLRAPKPTNVTDVFKSNGLW